MARSCEEKSILIGEINEAQGCDEIVSTPAYRAMLDEHNLSYPEARDLQLNSLQV